MTDTELLMGTIKKRGYKIKHVAEQVGLSSYGFKLKAENKSEFKTSEVSALCELLGIDSLLEKEKIFFAKKDDLKSSPIRQINAEEVRKREHN